MNCKPDDTARFIEGPNRDRLCRIIGPYEVSPLMTAFCGPQGPCWEIEMLQSGVMGLDHRLVPAGTTGWAPDAVLKPIRDLGDDAVDEMVRLVGKAPRLVFEPRTLQKEEATA
jgi:hypothetical protein